MCVYITYMCRLWDNSLTQVSGAHYQQQIITSGANVSDLHRHSRWYRANNFRRCVQTFRKFTCYENVPLIYKYFWFEWLRIRKYVYWKWFYAKHSPIKSVHRTDIYGTIRMLFRKKSLLLFEHCVHQFHILDFQHLVEIVNIWIYTCNHIILSLFKIKFNKYVCVSVSKHINVCV